MDHKTLMIGIAGGTGSGKTTLVRKLGLRFGDSVSVVCHDWYYRAQNGLSLEERARQNYDCPEAFETDLLVRDLARLRDGQAIDCPQYDYTVHNRSEATVRVSPASVVVVEGLPTPRCAICSISAFLWIPMPTYAFCAAFRAT